MKPLKPNRKKQMNPPKNNERKQIRLNRFLAISGIDSRRKCDHYILEGRVKVNGETVERLGERIDPEKDRVTFDGKPVKAAQNFVYILLNKPLHTVTTVSDERKRRTVIDILNLPRRLFPVGRLDFNTTGALLITNDGDLAYFLMHPKFEVKKTYRVMLDGLIRPVDLHHFRNGIVMDGRKTAPCKVKELRRIDNCSFLEVELHEGRNRQIRRMFEMLGYQVETLNRVNFAGLNVNDLKPGEWRELTRGEVQRLKKMVETYKERMK